MRTDIRSLFKRRGIRLGCGLGAALLLQTVAGLAGPKDFAVYSTRLGGDASTAQPYVDKLAGYLEATLGWPKGSTKGQFFTSKKDVMSGINLQKPGFAFIEPQLYLEMSGQWVECLAGVESTELNTTKLNVVVKDPAYKTLADLKGKKLWTTMADWPRYLSNVILDGKGAADKTFELKQIGAVTKGARAVLRGEADATLLDDQQLEEMKKLEGGAALRTIYSSRKLPPLLVVASGLPAADQKTLTKALLEMCGTAKGGEVCKEMRITKFVPVDKATIKAAKEAYDKP